MRKISNVEARQIIAAGFPVKALIARTYKPVNNLIELEDLIRLEKLGVQHFELYYTPEDIEVPENCYIVSLDEALDLLINNNEKVYSKLGGKELEFSSPSEVVDYVKSCITEGDSGILYWYVS